MVDHEPALRDLLLCRARGETLGPIPALLDVPEWVHCLMQVQSDKRMRGIPVDWYRVWMKAACDPEWCVAWEAVYVLTHKQVANDPNAQASAVTRRLRAWLQKSTTRQRAR